MSSLPHPASGQFEEELIANAVCSLSQYVLTRLQRKIASPGKGILAADESVGTIGSRFSKINLENNSENRRAYRELLFTSPGTVIATLFLSYFSGITEYISGAILFEETLMEHRTADGSKRLADLLLEQGIIVGIKVDAGLKPLAGTNGEVAVQGLTDLGDRCKKFYAAGARFAKWRAAFTIDLANGKPSELCVREQAWGLGRYAAICQVCLTVTNNLIVCRQTVWSLS
jgi:fructose-bisphosphate aldolase class I